MHDVGDGNVWRAFAEAMARANRADLRRLGEASRSYVQSLRWLADAWELADRHAADEPSVIRRERRGQELMRQRAALERARLSP